MSTTSFYTAISGLRAYGQAMGVISNNIANVNTIGFKGSRTAFEDMLSQQMTGTSGQSQVGRGVRVAAVHRLFDQATFETTGSGTDLAIDGNGFFIVTKAGLREYTRAGQFYLDEDGLLINHQQYVLQGWGLDEDGNIDSTLQDINLSSITSAPEATDNVEMHLNLDANATTLGPGTFDVLDPLNTSNYSNSLTVYDALGNWHLATFYYTKADTDSWEWNLVLQGGEVVGQPNDFVAASGTLDFTDGRMQTETITAPFGWQFNGTTAAQTMDFEFGESIDEGGSGLDGTSQFAGESLTKFLSQDGYARGDLVSIQIDQDGLLSGMFNNGHSRAVYQLALARFTSPWGLSSTGKTMFVETAISGPPIIGEPGTTGLGSVNSNTLEMSNVDLATEFVEMIKTQQAFQANSRVITTTDQLLQEVVNLKR
jgi:flagellar hook protein FlgE